MVGNIHEHKGKQELFIEANIDELKKLLDVALIQSTDASNRIEGIYTSDKRLKKLVYKKAEPHNRSEQEIAGYREVLTMIHETYEYIRLSPNIILQLHRDLYSYSQKMLEALIKMLIMQLQKLILREIKGQGLYQFLFFKLLKQLKTSAPILMTLGMKIR